MSLIGRAASGMLAFTIATSQVNSPSINDVRSTFPSESPHVSVWFQGEQMTEEEITNHIFEQIPNFREQVLALNLIALEILNNPSQYGYDSSALYEIVSQDSRLTNLEKYQIYQEGNYLLDENNDTNDNGAGLAIQSDTFEVGGALYTFSYGVYIDVNSSEFRYNLRLTNTSTRYSSLFKPGQSDFEPIGLGGEENYHERAGIWGAVDSLLNISKGLRQLTNTSWYSAELQSVFRLISDFNSAVVYNIPSSLYGTNGVNYEVLDKLLANGYRDYTVEQNGFAVVITTEQTYPEGLNLNVDQRAIITFNTNDNGTLLSAWIDYQSETELLIGGVNKDRKEVMLTGVYLEGVITTTNSNVSFNRRYLLEIDGVNYQLTLITNVNGHSISLTDEDGTTYPVQIAHLLSSVLSDTFDQQDLLDLLDRLQIDVNIFDNLDIPVELGLTTDSQGRVYRVASLKPGNRLEVAFHTPVEITSTKADVRSVKGRLEPGQAAIFYPLPHYRPYTFINGEGLLTPTTPVILPSNAVEMYSISEPLQWELSAGVQLSNYSYANTILRPVEYSDFQFYFTQDEAYDNFLYDFKSIMNDAPTEIVNTFEKYSQSESRNAIPYELILYIIENREFYPEIYRKLMDEEYFNIELSILTLTNTGQSHFCNEDVSLQKDCLQTSLAHTGGILLEDNGNGVTSTFFANGHEFVLWGTVAKTAIQDGKETSIGAVPYQASFTLGEFYGLPLSSNVEPEQNIFALNSRIEIMTREYEGVDRWVSIPFKNVHGNISLIFVDPITNQPVIISSLSSGQNGGTMETIIDAIYNYLIQKYPGKVDQNLLNSTNVYIPDYNLHSMTIVWEDMDTEDTQVRVLNPNSGLNEESRVHVDQYNRPYYIALYSTPNN